MTFLTKSPDFCILLEFILAINSAYTLPAWLPFFIKNSSSLTFLKLFKPRLQPPFVCINLLHIGFCFLLSVWVHPPGVWSQLCHPWTIIKYKYTKAQCRHLKKTVKGLCGRCLSVWAPSPPSTPYSPPYTHTCILYSYSEGRGRERWTREKVRGATVNKAGSKISPVYKLW